MDSEKKARHALVERLRATANATESEVVKIDLRQAANEIEDLADKLDFRMADQLSSGVMKAIQDTIKYETGWDAFCGPFIVNNTGFGGVIEDPSPDGYKWVLTCHREERDAAEPSIGN